MKSECTRCQSINLVLRAILEQMTQNLASIADDKQSCWLKNKENDRLNIIDYQSCYWQWSSSMFIRYNHDFDDDNDDDSATFAV